MRYLTIPISTIRSPQYIGAEPVDRATWLNLLVYCAEQENGGRIENCSEWPSRMWEQLAGVTLAEVKRDCALWRWDGNSIEVFGYPRYSEQMTIARRERAVAAAKQRWTGQPQQKRDEEVKPAKKKTEQPTPAPPQQPLILEPPKPTITEEDIYNEYPRRVGKPAALRAIRRVVKRYGAEYVLERTRKFAEAWAGASREELQFCPHPSTWFYQERFSDSPETWRGAVVSKSPSDTVETIKLQNELERIEARMKQIREQASWDAWGPQLTKEEANEMKRLKARKKAILDALGFAA